MDGIEAQRVDVELTLPIERILEKISPHVIALGPIEVQRISPCIPIFVGEIGSELLEVIPFRPQMVINDIERNRQSGNVAGIDQLFQARGAAI